MNISEIKEKIAFRLSIGYPDGEYGALGINTCAISLSRWGAALAFSESTSTINRLEAIAFRVASVQSSPVEISRSVIQHLTCAN